LYLEDINDLKNMKAKLGLSPTKMSFTSELKVSCISKNAIQSRSNLVPLFAL